ncbi:hypothetical protein [Enhygromyxa salina]|uniref:Uncharacterized protein n=1 Tax=Enhygromyxa salina TaxID=215803 RepID=A0A2S9YTL4_9BACT|nr:hypothetical protein [Enhygromyxa salina]PRQ08372.1 hypothetical protein ENSA7_19990 [Enhygromyxa salina]
MTVARKLLKARVALVGAGLAAVVAGMFVGTTGCCDVEPIADASYEIVESPNRPELVGATVEIHDDVVEIFFADVDSDMWIVRYAVASRSP